MHELGRASGKLDCICTSVPVLLQTCFLEIHQDWSFFYVLVVLVVFVVRCNQGLDFIIAICTVSSVLHLVLIMHSTQKS